MDPSKTPARGLKRVISVPMLLLYGLGNILGAGIYVLVGEVAGVAGYHAPLVFLVASLLVIPTALSYAELSARFPVSAGESVYLYEAFGKRWLSVLVGLLIAAAALVSIAALARGFAGYLSVLVEFPQSVTLLALVCILGVVCALGIGISVTLASVLTLVEVAGLLMILYVAGDRFAALPGRLDDILLPESAGVLPGMIVGAFLAFFAFLGFEDMVNVAEEVRDPARSLPRAIAATLVIALLLYVAIATVAVLTLAPQELAGSGAPLAMIYQEATGSAPTAITVIGLFAAVNGALVQMIMASRIVYGMSRKNWLPEPLGRIHPLTRTPVIATTLVTVAVLALGLTLPLLTLAWATSFIILVVFTLMNWALWRLKRLGPAPPGAPDLPRSIPLAGGLLSLAFVLANVALMLGGRFAAH